MRFLIWSSYSWFIWLLIILTFYLSCGFKVPLITGNGRYTYRNRLLRDETSESSTDETEEYQTQYHGSIPKLVITLDRENNQLQDDQSPDTPGCPLEFKSEYIPQPIPIFTFTCEDVDAHQSGDDLCQDTYVPEVSQVSPLPPPVPDPPPNYDQSSESGEAICLPPEMKPIDTKLTLDLFNARSKDEDYRRRCTGVDECVSACECCRTPQPEAQQIPYIDEPNSEPVIFENDCFHNKVATPKIRRILPSLSLDLTTDEKKPKTADATCQTPNSPLETDTKPRIVEVTKKVDLNLNLKRTSHDIQNIQCQLKKTLYSMSKSLSSKSDDTDGPSISTTESFDGDFTDVVPLRKVPPVDTEVNDILHNVAKKSWKSPDEYRPAFGKVKALTKHFNQINLRYCAKSYKRNCRSSPNLSTGVNREPFAIKEHLPASASLADIQYECEKTDTDNGKTDKMSEDEVKSILIQLEDWSKFGSRGSEDTLAQGNEFELPNLPSEDHTETVLSTAGSLIFNEILDKKPKTITLEDIKLKSNQNSVKRPECLESLKIKTGSLENMDESRVFDSKFSRKHVSSADVSRWRREPPTCKPTLAPSMK